MNLREQVMSVLIDYTKYDWETQGFGMLRTYLPGEGEPRFSFSIKRMMKKITKGEKRMGPAEVSYID